jgi:hypothetical protein
VSQAAVSRSSEATANQNPRPGVAYRPRDAQPIPVWLAWWKDDPRAYLTELVNLTCETYRASQPGRGVD